MPRAVCAVLLPLILARSLPPNAIQTEPNLKWTNPCLQDPLKSSPVCNTTLPLDARAAALTALLTNDEKVGLLVNTAAAVPRLNLPAYEWWSEALHGVAKSPGVTFGGQTPVATSFPQVILTAASFNSSLFHSIGQVVSTEARAFNNVNHAGLTYWAPNINIFRDPRWGRGHETPGEDPVLSAAYAGAFPLGLQDGEAYPKYLKSSACCKHFAAYSLENWHGVSRHQFNAIVTQQDLYDTYFPAFQSCVQIARASSVMCSYNAVNGVPSCASKELLTDIVRDTWGFDGYVTSDCGAVADVLNEHHYTNSTDETCRVTLAAGMDSNCGVFLFQNLKRCIDSGVCSDEIVNNALNNLFRVQLRLGMFDPADDQPYLKISTDQIDTPEHRQLALEAALQGIVLLKNSNSRLPLASDSGVIAVIGPHANATTAMQANYEGVAPYLISPYDGIRAIDSSAIFAQGCNVACRDTSGFSEAIQAAKSADHVVVVVGLDMSIEDEGVDRETITLPNNQLTLATQICKAASKPIVVVILSGGSVDVSALENSDCVGAIVWAGYPGQSGGDAIAKILFGHHNPAGRLSQTFYPADFVNQVSLFDMGMRPNATSGNPGRTHRFYTGTPVYPFGHGLSYSPIVYSNERLTVAESFNSVGDGHVPRASRSEILGAALRSRGNIRDGMIQVAVLEVSVCNQGEYDGRHILLVFSVPPNAGLDGAPLRQLAAFEPLHLASHQCVDVKVSIPVSALHFANLDGDATSPQGRWRLVVGQPGQIVTDLVVQ